MGRSAAGGTLRRIGTVVGLLGLLGGCGEISTNPFAWWASLSGGAIAEQRPAPPGAADPYPNLGRVPARPAPVNEAQRQALSRQLVADRSAAEEQGARDPLAATPGQPGAAQPAAPLVARPVAAPAPPNLPPQVPGAASASFQAAEATAPPTPAPPTPAPPTPAPPTPATKSAAMNPASTGGAAASPSAVLAANAPLPAIPTAPPPPPSGLPEPRSAPIATPSPAGLPPPDVPGHTITLAFRTGLATPPGDAASRLAPLVAARGGRGVQVTGRGEAASYAPAAQAAALTLALHRAQALAAQLRTQGVPDSAMSIQAQPFGRGATASLID